MTMPTRNDYRTLTTQELKRKYWQASARSERASTDTGYLADAFLMQEILAALDERGVTI